MKCLNLKQKRCTSECILELQASTYRSSKRDIAHVLPPANLQKFQQKFESRILLGPSLGPSAPSRHGWKHSKKKTLNYRQGVLMSVQRRMPWILSGIQKKKLAPKSQKVLTPCTATQSYQTRKMLELVATCTSCKWTLEMSDQKMIETPSASAMRTMFSSLCMAASSSFRLPMRSFS